METIADLSPAEVERVKAALARRDEQHRAAIADLLTPGTNVEQIMTRFGYKRAKSVYNLCHRFEHDAGRRFEWPWRRRKHPGPKPKPLAA